MSSYNPIYHNDYTNCPECRALGIMCSSCEFDDRPADDKNTLFIMDPDTGRIKDRGPVKTYRDEIRRNVGQPSYIHPPYESIDKSGPGFYDI